MGKTAFALLLCGIVAGCSQTSNEAAPAASASPKPTSARTVASEERCNEAIRSAARDRQNTAMAGSMISSVAGFGGFAGRGGAIVGQAASVGGSLMQAQARNNASNTVLEECR